MNETPNHGHEKSHVIRVLYVYKRVNEGKVFANFSIDSVNLHYGWNVIKKGAKL